MILEEVVRGRELEMAAMGNEDVRVSRPARSSPAGSSTTTRTSTCSGRPRRSRPPTSTDAQLAHAQRVATAAYRALRVEGLARVDLFLPDDDEIVVNEVNTMPGFTPISMFPMLWEAEGLSFAAVVEELVLLAQSRHARRQALRTHRLV